MRRTLVAVVALVGSLFVAACNGDSTTTSLPRGTPQAAPSRTLLALTCSNSTFNTMAQDAKAYFPAKDPVFDSIPVMKKLFGTSAAAATPTGFHILSRTATVRDAGSQIGSAAAGGKFVLDVVGCMSVGSVDDTFKPDQALDKGVFELRGADASLAPVLAEVASVSHATVNASPLWGAEPNTSWTRAAAPNGFLVYGYSLGADVRASGFEMGTIPQSIGRDTSSVANLFRVGLCIHASNGDNSAANRLIHGGAIVTGLFDPSSSQDQGANFCSGHVIASTASSSWVQRFASNALALLSPKSAFAMQGLGDLGIGGLPDGWSPMVPNAIPGTSIGVAIQTHIQNTFADSLFTIVVKASDPSGPVPGVSVTISVDNNHGVPADAIVHGQTTGTTGVDGTVTLKISVGKAGGYILAASGSISGVPTPTGLSNQFQVQNK